MSGRISDNACVDCGKPMVCVIGDYYQCVECEKDRRAEGPLEQTFLPDSYDPEEASLGIDRSSSTTAVVADPTADYIWNRAIIDANGLNPDPWLASVVSSLLGESAVVSFYGNQYFVAYRNSKHSICEEDAKRAAQGYLADQKLIRGYLERLRDQ